MPAMTQEHKDEILAAETLDGWFVMMSEDELNDTVDMMWDYPIRKELIKHMGTIRIDNCGSDTYELAERVEDAMYRREFGVFWKIIKKGRYLKDRLLFLQIQNMKSAREIQAAYKAYKNTAA